jgi:nicotinate dehydrogenase subunit B
VRGVLGAYGRQGDQELRAPVSKASGKAITTLEGLPSTWANVQGVADPQPALHPLQQAWIDVQVPHCGYCQNGMMIQAADLLASNANPTEDEIRHGMNGHLCRCGTYPRILAAIQRAATVMANGGATDAAAKADDAPLGDLAVTPTGFMPDATQVDSWLTINPDNTVTVKMSNPEVGQGLATGLLMIAAEELDLELGQMRYAAGDTSLSVYTAGDNEGGMAGSFGIVQSGPRLRAAAVAAREALLSLASNELGVPVSDLTVSKGVFSGADTTITYGELAGDRLLNATVGPALEPGAAGAKPVEQYTLVGTSQHRIDIPSKINGRHTYIHDVRLPGMLHARVVRPRGQGAVKSANHRPETVDESSISHIPGARVVRVGDFLAVVAPREWDAIRAARELKVEWKSDPKLPGTEDFWRWLREVGDGPDGNAQYTVDVGDVEAALASAAKVVSATYKYAYNGHMPIGPTCAIADIHSDHATIYANTQHAYAVSANLAELMLDGRPYLGLAPEQIRVLYYEGASSFGSMIDLRTPYAYPGAGTDAAGHPRSVGAGTDAYHAATVLSKELGVPVRVQWMRWDENGWDSYGPAGLFDVRGGIDESGRMVALDWVSYCQGQTVLQPTVELTGMSTWPTVPPGASLDARDQYYAVSNENKRVLMKTQPLYAGSLKGAALRAPDGMQPTFAGEQMVDELAHAANMDPIAFRKLNVDASTVLGRRWIATLEALEEMADWSPKVTASNPESRDVVTGRGVAIGSDHFGTQAAMVADIEVSMKTGKIVAKHLYLAYNTGFTISPDLVANQASGGAIMGLSRALYEEVTFTEERVTGVDWVSYPILRFAETPLVTVGVVHPGGHLVVNPGAVGESVVAGNVAALGEGWDATGGGEAGTVPPPAAVANAFFDATGVRIRETPMTFARVLAELKAAGVVPEAPVATQP